MNKKGELTLIVLSVIVILFLGGLGLQFLKSDDSISGLAVNEINLANANAFSYGHACARNSDCRSNICSNRKCVDCLSDNNCGENQYCNASKNCVPKADIHYSCKSDNECLFGLCYDSVCIYNRPCINNDDCGETSDECINNKCKPKHAGLAELPSGLRDFYCERHKYNNGIVDIDDSVQILDKSIRQQMVYERDYAVGGLVDVCASTSKLLQAKCIGYEGWYVEEICPLGQICSKGACVVNRALPQPNSVKTSTLTSKIRTSITNLFRR